MLNTFKNENISGTGAVVATAQSVAAAGLGTAGTLAAGAISGAAGFMYADDDC
jgi:hypothetical protein